MKNDTAELDIVNYTQPQHDRCTLRQKNCGSLYTTDPVRGQIHIVIFTCTTHDGGDNLTENDYDPESEMKELKKLLMNQIKDSDH